MSCTTLVHPRVQSPGSRPGIVGVRSYSIRECFFERLRGFVDDSSTQPVILVTSQGISSLCGSSARVPPVPRSPQRSQCLPSAMIQRDGSKFGAFHTPSSSCRRTLTYVPRKLKQILSIDVQIIVHSVRDMEDFTVRIMIIKRIS